jgi:hypothetical protein
MSDAGAGYPVRTQLAPMSGTLQPSADGMSAKVIRSHLQAKQAPRRAPSKFVGAAQRPSSQDDAEVRHARRESTPSPAPRPG